MPSNNNTTSSSSEKEWPVELFRHTESDGWQQQMPRGSNGSAILHVAPRKDCIVIPALRQKFTLSGKDDPKDRSSVVRRGECILLVSRRRTRAMVLKFKSLHDCQEFADRFVELNPRMNEEAKAPHQMAGEQEQQEVVSYVARLLHDADFLQFVNKVEKFVSNTKDGVKMLEALDTRDLDTVEPVTTNAPI